LRKTISDVSPDKKFAMRIRYNAELNRQATKAENADARKIFSQPIKAIQLVSLPDKSVMANFLADQKLGGEYDLLRFTVKFDEKADEFRIISKKRVTSGLPHGYD
jgi:hypothetical protein